MKQLESNKNISDQQLTKMQKEIISLEQQLAKQEAQNQAMKQELDKKNIKFQEEIKQAKNSEKENQKESFSNVKKIRKLEQENTEFKKIVSTLQFELEQTQTLYSVEKSKYEKCKEFYDDLIVGQEELEEAVFQQKSQIKILEGINKQLSKQNKENLDKIEILSQEQEQVGELDQKFLKQNQILQRKKKEIQQKYYQNQQDHQETVYKLEKIIREQNIKIQKFMDEQELYREQASKENREKMSLQVQLEKEKDSKIKIKSDLGLASIKIQEMVELEKRIQNKNNYIQQLEKEIDDLKKKIRQDPNLNFNHDINYYKNSQNEKFVKQNQQKQDYDNELFGNQKQIVEKIIEKPVYVEKPVEIKVLDKGKDRAYENQIYDQKREIDRLESRITEYKNENLKLRELLNNSRQYDQEFAQKQNENMKEKYENQIQERDEIINDLKIRQEKLLTEIEFLAQQNIQRNNEVRSFLQEKNSEFQIQNGNQRVCRSFTQGFNPNNISNINNNDDENQNIYIQESDIDQFQE
ncbi:hypothetical protein PPERSA_04380 [Pseudocohnilembus persalinus]|uniref:Uncharacterized protein n=1 Tax=Pseudocohnilembus persalinus TaxID=266149 RepID=A0A0V0QRF7_PSEPJ|nr:hypothetical protein PPERSA_04380 [Pseudocohnilembus persalinus]|eukprot:KRX04565.1 hypothetical protein PPERSA_04380 [Pseudocohnilembus persalinus]